ncbi:MAG TPA: IS1182 family transposase [Thermoanaerobaculia bacterium]|nr:IS1182 family transposase [Thermoanaerobaculia bacterium]
MSLGTAPSQKSIFDEASEYCAERLSERSVYSWLHRERERLFPDGDFADLYSTRGRRSVAPSVVATVMVLQRLEGCSDREAVERFAFDVRWRYAAGVSGWGEDACREFVHTVLVDMRERLRGSARPDRIFEASLEAAKSAGVLGRRRVLDSTALYDAVTTMDTVTLIRSAMRSLLQVCDAELAQELRAVIRSGDDYASTAKPQIDWSDPEARHELIDSRARDAFACLAQLEGRELSPAVSEASRLLATVIGQDLETEEDGSLRIARRVARDRVISTVDPEARHGHKTSSRGFDGYKGNVAVDPDSEVITKTAVTPANAGEVSVAEELIDDLLGDDGEAVEATVYGDSAYGSGEFQARLQNAGIDSRCKTQPASNADGFFSKDRFAIDLKQGTVTCPAGHTVLIQRYEKRSDAASFGTLCAACPLRSQCTRATAGRTIRIGPYEEALSQARQRQNLESWRADYRATRPKIERKIGHMMRRRHGGRRARVRGRGKVDADFRLLAAALNLTRLAVLGIRSTAEGWAVA